MGWDPVWERIFRERPRWGKYPPEELVRFIAQNYYQAPDRLALRVLEVGCGPGGGPSWFVAREGFTFSGIDGSETAIEKARRRFREESLRGEFVCGPIDVLPWSDETFDCVIDVACLQHNLEKDAQTIVGEIYRVLKPGGRHFSLTTTSGCWGDGTGERVDETSYTNVSEGPFADMGIVRFATRESVLRLYSGFKVVNLEYSKRSMNGCRKEISNWIVTCEK